MHHSIHKLTYFATAKRNKPSRTSLKNGSRMGPKPFLRIIIPPICFPRDWVQVLLPCGIRLHEPNVVHFTPPPERGLLCIRSVAFPLSYAKILAILRSLWIANAWCC